MTSAEEHSLTPAEEQSLTAAELRSTTPPSSVRIHGKVILAGEHSAVRGHPAIVAPLRSRSLTLTYSPGNEFSVAEGPIREPFTLAMKKAVEILGRPLPTGSFSVSSDIPLRAGLGSSAALSVAIARFLLPEAEYKTLFPLALSLEDIFHGKSSGIDVAAALSPSPILFRRGSAPEGLGDWRPHLFLSDTHLRSSTKACVEQVAALGRPDLDEKMAGVVMGMKGAFLAQDTSALAAFMEEARACFEAWGLIPDEVAGQISHLKNQGALAVKPTGSGNGGFLLSLWREPPSLLPLWP